jgi:hypothetical protein
MGVRDRRDQPLHSRHESRGDQARMPCCAPAGVRTRYPRPRRDLPRRGPARYRLPRHSWLEAGRQAVAPRLGRVGLSPFRGAGLLVPREQLMGDHGDAGPPCRGQPRRGRPFREARSCFNCPHRCSPRAACWMIGSSWPASESRPPSGLVGSSLSGIKVGDAPARNKLDSFESCLAPRGPGTHLVPRACPDVPRRPGRTGGNRDSGTGRGTSARHRRLRRGREETERISTLPPAQHSALPSGRPSRDVGREPRHTPPWRRSQPPP